MAVTQLRDTQKVTGSINPKNAKGNPARVDGIPEWASTDPNVANVVPAADGLSATVLAGVPGTTQIRVTADVDLGSGVRSLTEVGDIEVVAGEAVGLGISFGVPEEQ